MTELSYNTNILYFCEGFHESENTIHENVILINKQVHTDPANKNLNHGPAFITRNKKKHGRPSNGSGFIVDKSLNVEYTIYNSRISYLQVNSLIIIGCYFPFYGGVTNEDKLRNEHEYTKTLSELNVLIGAIRDENVEIVVLGDFNTDFSKNYDRRDQLAEFSAQYSFTCADICLTQSIDYTYFKIVEQELVTSWIDHVFVEELMINLQDCRIESSVNNLGDHNAIVLTYDLHYRYAQKPILKKIKK